MRLLLLLLMCSGLTVAAARRYGMISPSASPPAAATILQVPVEIVGPGGTIEHRQVPVKVEK